jgi:peroxiredoxin
MAISLNMHFYLFSLLLLVNVFQLDAQTTLLYGKAPDYSGKEITFYTIPDPILLQKLELASTKVAPDGTFSVTFQVTSSIEICTDLEKYCGTMVVEPGKNYEVTLPPFTLRNSVEAHSAYFKPAFYWLGLPGTGNTDLNFSIRSFITDFNLETVKNTVPIYQNKSKEVVNEIIELLEKKYSDNRNDYFRTLKRFYYAELEYAIYQRTPEIVIQKYFSHYPVHLSHPVYQRAFETFFTDFLRKQSQDIQSQKIVSVTDSGDYAGLVSFFEKRGYEMEFAELVVLKGLYDGYYSGGFSKEGVIKAIEMARTATASPVLQTIAQQIKSKLTLLAVGGKAPEIRLSNQNKETVTLDRFSGKFVYLSFFKSTSSDCRTELDSIVTVEKKFRQVLKVVSVALDDDFTEAAKLWKTKGYTWELLNGSKQKQLVINYNASITPAFYLIAPDGTLLLSPAPSPTHGFEPFFLKEFRNYHFKHKP